MLQMLACPCTQARRWTALRQMFSSEVRPEAKSSMPPYMRSALPPVSAVRLHPIRACGDGVHCAADAVLSLAAHML